MKVRPVSGWIDTAHLLHALGPNDVSANLPDGVAPMADLPRAFPAAEWTRIWFSMFSPR